MITIGFLGFSKAYAQVVKLGPNEWQAYLELQTTDHTYLTLWAERCPHKSEALLAAFDLVEMLRLSVQERVDKGKDELEEAGEEAR